MRYIPAENNEIVERLTDLWGIKIHDVRLLELEIYLETYQFVEVDKIMAQIGGLRSDKELFVFTSSSNSIYSVSSVSGSHMAMLSSSGSVICIILRSICRKLSKILDMVEHRQELIQVLPSLDLDTCKWVKMISANNPPPGSFQKPSRRPHRARQDVSDAGHDMNMSDVSLFLGWSKNELQQLVNDVSSADPESPLKEISRRCQNMKRMVAVLAQQLHE